jgi:hypothetical protein
MSKRNSAPIKPRVTTHPAVVTSSIAGLWRQRVWSDPVSWVFALG